MSMPSYWYDPMVNTLGVPGNDGGVAARLDQSATNSVAANNALANQTFQQGQDNFWNWSDNATKLNAAYTASNLAIGNAQPVGTYNGNALSPFATGAPPIQHLGGTNGLQPFNPGSYLVKNPDVFQAGADPWQHYNQFGQNEGREGAWGNTTFDTSNYLANNQDVWRAGANPVQHWLLSGYDEGRTGGFGGPDFNEQNYLANNPDVFKAGADPVQHWLASGQSEGRTGGWGENPFNAQEYLLQNRDVAASGADPLQHWMNYGYNEGREAAFGETEADDWSKYFSTATAGGGGANTGRDAAAAEYFLANPDVFAAAQGSGRDPTAFGFEHLMNFGDDENRRFFDSYAYLNDPANRDVFEAGANPFQHYYQFGQKEGRPAPLSGTFDDRWYGLQNPDVLAAGMDPTAHWFEYGAKEGRAGGPTFNTSGYKDPWAAGIPQGRNSRDVLAAVLAASQSTGINANALSALFGVESVWDPRSNSSGNPNWGVPQLSQDMWGDAPFNGVINGKTWEQYRTGTAADQIGVYADWLNRSGSKTRGGLDFAAQPEDMQFALLMANQLGGHYGMDWRTRIAGGDMTTPVYQGRQQAGELGNLSPQAFIKAYWDRVARWPTQQTNWGP